VKNSRLKRAFISNTFLTQNGVFELQDILATSFTNNTSKTFIAVNSFPNPASDHADLTFTLSHAAEVGVRLYSALGSEVWRSESAFLPAGEQRLRMDVRGLPTGVYAYRLTVGGVQSVGRLVVVR
jgi:Secretion system C-terminal sorting domain